MSASPLACPACGETQDDASAKFCEACGRPLGPIAPKTGSGCRCAIPAPDADGYCQNCGLKTADALRFADFEEFVDDRLAMACDRGRRHPTNQDNGGVLRRDDGVSLMVVADGVTTSEAPERAAAAAVAAAKSAFLSPSPGASLGEQARSCVDAAAAAVSALGGQPDATDGAASTIVLAVLAGPAFAVSWVGDSRAYSVMAGVPETLLTRDDSWCMDEVDAKRKTYEQAMLDENAHAITQWLGMPAAEMVVHTKEMTLPPGAALLLCSDGLWNYADAPRRLGLAYTEASKEADAVTTCRRLVAFANAAGGRDNVTVAIAVNRP